MSAPRLFSCFGCIRRECPQTVGEHSVSAGRNSRCACGCHVAAPEVEAVEQAQAESIAALLDEGPAQFGPDEDEEDAQCPF